MSTVLKSLAEELQARRLKAIAAYKTLVSLVAGEKKLPPTSDIEATLSGSGKSLEDLQGDVKTAKRRADLRAQIALAEELQKERPAIDEQIAKHKAALAKAQELHDSAMAPLRQRIESINHAHNVAAMALGELQRSTPDDFDDRRDELEQAVRQADAEVRSAQKHLSVVESRLSSARLEIPVDQSAIDEYTRQVSSAKARLQSCQDASGQALADQEELLRQMLAS